MRPTLAALILTVFSSSAIAQTPLQNEIRKIAATADGKVSVSCSLPDSSLNCDLEPHSHPPMQSVFKLPLAVCALHQIEQGKFSLDQTIRFLPSDLFPQGTYSPLQDKYLWSFRCPCLCKIRRRRRLPPERRRTRLTSRSPRLNTATGSSLPAPFNFCANSATILRSRPSTPNFSSPG